MIAASAAAAAALALLAAASAGAKLSERSERSGVIKPGSETAARVVCPSGARRHPISGGFASDSPWRADLNSTIAIAGSVPAGRRGWRVKAANFAGARETVTASVLCGKRDPKVRISRGSTRVAPGEGAVATARCRRAEEAIAGGFAAPGFTQDRGPEVLAVSSRRQGRHRWRVGAYNNSATAAGRLVAIARCAKRRPGLRTVRLKGIAVDQAPVELAPRCRRGEELWSGGFEATFQSFDPFAAIIADRSYADGRRWVSRFVGYQTAGEVTAIAYCAKRR